ncbi:hypothetical protein [Sodalis ligni]|uniref:Uncharacterized protein n=1 Tax=Sodalis ligni TaxID=2697027 RepID=A0A4R1NQ51_9GAMM|nr:hypothetical protein [Sodalis ligni]TCL06866.1 hypothetical protein EZJ58_5163 [Sodalis ligni]
MKLSIYVDEFERADINDGIRSLIRSGYLKENESSQFSRVLHAAAGPTWRTLRDLELLVLQMYGVADTQAAISARLREVKPEIHGLKKERRYIKDPETLKIVHFYRLVAAEKETAE